MKTTSLVKASLAILLAFALASCDEKHQQTESKPRPDFDIVAANGNTFLIERHSGEVRILKRDKLLRVPFTDESQENKAAAVKTLSGETLGLSINARFKFHNGQLMYQVSVEPKLSKEYSAYMADQFQRALEQLKELKRSTDAKQGSDGQTNGNATGGNENNDSGTPDIATAPLPEPKEKYEDPQWADYWKVRTNALILQLQDADMFPVRNLDILLSPSSQLYRRTAMVDEKGKTAGYEYSGSIPIDLSDYEQINKMDTRWVLEKPKK